MSDEATGGGRPAPMCALHPERAADAGLCQRCGTYMCGDCVEPASDPPLCRPCYERRFGSKVVGHVPVFAIFTMIHGGLLSLAGAFFLLYGGSLGLSFASMPEPSGEGTEHVRDMENIMVVAALVMSLPHLVVGPLQLWAGWRMRTYRSRGLVIAALISGMLTVMGCYCLPTSLVLLVWGLVIVLNPAVAERFARTSRT